MDYRKIAMLQPGARAPELRATRAGLDSRDLDDLGHAALLERLARALARRRSAQ